MAEERGFEVVDRRRISAEGELKSEETESSGSEEAAAGEEADQDPIGGAAATGTGSGEEPEEDLESGGTLGELSVDGILMMALNFLSQHAWASLGLVPNPMTGKIEQNLPEARRAIDAIADVTKHLEATASPEEKRELQTMVSNLRLNYVRQSG